MKRRLVWRSVAVLAVLGGAVALVLTEPIRLGLDLRGGTQIVLQAQPTQREDVDNDTLVRTVEVLRRRVDQLGVSEPTLQASGEDRIIVELPGVTDPEEALEVIGRTAQLTFHPVAGVSDRAAGEGREQRNRGADEGLTLPDEAGARLRLAPSAMTGDVVENAQAIVSQTGANWEVAISFRDEGAARWARLTGDAACAQVGAPQRRVAIVLDNEIISSPEVAPDVACDQGITGGETVITGDFDEQEAKDLALLIRAGALPVPVEVIEQRTVGPTLGDAAIQASVRAAIIGALLTILYVIAYYRLLGALAALALLAYGLISYASLLGLQATLTLPGIAGFVLAIGMAVDANVLVFERAKEEFTDGRPPQAAVRRGFAKAWSAIADSNATTVLAAVILFYFATGAVRGFGITLTVGVVVSMFTALVITRVLADLLTSARAVRQRPSLLGLTVGGRLRHRLEERPTDLMTHKVLWFGISLAVLVAAVAGLTLRGLNFGVEFTGGRLIEYSTRSEVDLDNLRSRLAAAGFPRAVVQETGDGNVSIRSGELSEADEERVARIVGDVGAEVEEVRDEFIGPTIGEELRRKALIALTLGLGAQLVYLAVRFRWTFGTSAVAAMFHDILILLGVFAWLGKDIDGVFVAALLTVIGYSINDSVVVFDRIREQRGLRTGVRLSRVVNDACLQTIPRTINTGLGALFILIALYLLGGETLTDFALALIVGIAVGTYSSVFTAAPLLLTIENATTQPPPVESKRKHARQIGDEENERVAVGSPPGTRSSSSSPAGTATGRARVGSNKRKRRRRRN